MGTCRSPFIGIWYCTYIWLTVMSPVCAGTKLLAGVETVLFSPPTKKLPCSLIVSGAAGAAKGTSDRRPIEKRRASIEIPPSQVGGLLKPSGSNVQSPSAGG